MKKLKWNPLNLSPTKKEQTENQFEYESLQELVWLGIKSFKPEIISKILSYKQVKAFLREDDRVGTAEISILENCIKGLKVEVNANSKEEETISNLPKFEKALFKEFEEALKRLPKVMPSELKKVIEKTPVVEIKKVKVEEEKKTPVKVKKNEPDEEKENTLEKNNRVLSIREKRMSFFSVLNKLAYKKLVKLLTDNKPVADTASSSSSFSYALLKKEMDEIDNPLKKLELLNLLFEYIRDNEDKTYSKLVKRKFFSKPPNKNGLNLTQRTHIAILKKLFTETVDNNYKEKGVKEAPKTSSLLLYFKLGR